MNSPTVKICIPVFANDLETLIARMRSAQQEADLLELRAEFLPGLDEQMIRHICNEAKKPIIFTCRKTSQRPRTDEERYELSCIAMKYASFVDIELELIKHFNRPKSSQAKLIISHHDFLDTPSYWELQHLIYTINTFQPDIVKIACHTKEPYDVIKIYRLLVNKPHTENRIVIGMGEKGIMTRILGPLLGSFLTYAAGDWGESAPGQLSIAEMKRIYQAMGVPFGNALI